MSDVEETQKRLGKRVRELRKERKMSQGELADRSGLALMTISRLERGEHAPNTKTIGQVAEGLGVPIWELLR